MSCKSIVVKPLASRFLFLSAIVLFLLAGMSSCRKVIIYPGSSKIISRETDATLADSVLIFGKVVSAIDTASVLVNARIWIKEGPQSASSNRKGLYSLKLPAGRYTLYCKEDLVSDEFLETISTISLAPNEKVEIHFFIGGKVE